MVSLTRKRKIMKIFSDYKELEGQVFDTVEQCTEAEAKVEEQRKALAEQEKDKSKLKKSLAKEVDVAEENVKQAYINYDKAKEEVRKILEESNKQMTDILKPAKQAIADAEAARTEAIVNYNKQCGPYQKIYTGDRAMEEYKRISKQFDSIFNKLWNNFIW